MAGRSHTRKIRKQFKRNPGNKPPFVSNSSVSAGIRITNTGSDSVHRMLRELTRIGSNQPHGKLHRQTGRDIRRTIIKRNKRTI